VGTATAIKHDTTVNSEDKRGPMTLRNVWKEFNFVSKNSSPVFKTYGTMRPHSRYFQCLMKILKLLGPISDGGNRFAM
jgi:hypothetical protein